MDKNVTRFVSLLDLVSIGGSVQSCDSWGGYEYVLHCHGSSPSTLSPPPLIGAETRHCQSFCCEAEVSQI